MTTNTNSKKLLWIGWILSIIPAFMMVSGGIYALTKAPMVMEGTAHLGYPASLIVPLGLIEIICAILFLIPRTAFYGAILITAYFGGGVASDLRIGEPTYLIAILLGIVIWVALACRDTRFRNFLGF